MEFWHDGEHAPSERERDKKLLYRALFGFKNTQIFSAVAAIRAFTKKESEKW